MARSASMRVIAPLARPCSARNSSPAWVMTSTMALPTPTTSYCLADMEDLPGVRGGPAPRGGPGGYCRPFPGRHRRLARDPTRPTLCADERLHLPRRRAPTADHGHAVALRPHPRTRPRRGDVRRLGDHRRRRAPSRPTRSCSTPPTSRSTRPRSSRATRTVDSECRARSRGRAADGHHAPPSLRSGAARLHIEFSGVLNDQLRGFYRSTLHRRRRRRAGPGHHPVRVHRCPPGLPVLGRARAQGRVRGDAAGRPTTCWPSPTPREIERTTTARGGSRCGSRTPW